MKIYRSELECVHPSPDIPFHDFMFKRLEQLQKMADDPKNDDVTVAFINGSDESEVITFEMVLEFSKSLAAWFRHQNYKKGDRVLLCMSNCWQYAISCLGAWSAGLVISPTSPQFSSGEIYDQLHDSESVAIICDEASLEKIDTAIVRLRGNAIKQIICVSKHPLPDGIISFNETLFTSPVITPLNILLQDLLMLPYSSGTTGKPKGVMITHANYSYMVMNYLKKATSDGEKSAWGRMFISPKVVTYLPVYHALGIFHLMSNLYNGSCQIMMAKYNENELLKNINKHEIWVLASIPSILNSLVQNPLFEEMTSSLMVIGSGTAPLHKSVIEKLQCKLPGIRIAQGYGMTEMSTASHISDSDADPNSIGKLIPGTYMKMSLDTAAREAVRRVCEAAGAVDHPYCQNEFSVHRWIVAWQDEESAAQMLSRHLNIRKIMPLPPKNDEFSERMESYAPCKILGKNRESDNKILLLEQTGKIDIAGLVENLRLSDFMRNKFRMMEELHDKVVEQEKLKGKQSGGVLIMDLEGLSFNSYLLGVIVGPYRVMWGTLFDQYPQLIQQIIVVNAPKFVNLLTQAFHPFLPDDYKDKIIITSGDPAKSLEKYIDSTCLPSEYGGMDGDYEICMNIPTPVSPIPECLPIDVELEDVNIPAGGFTTHKYLWRKGEQLEFYLKSSQEFTYYIYYSEDDTRDVTKWREIFHGMTRPVLPQADVWQWTVPHEGYYYIHYGNERAWLFSVTVKTRIQSDKGELLMPNEVFQS